MSDPTAGPQKGKFPTLKNISKDQLGEINSWESNAPKDLGGGFNKKSGVREFEEGRLEHLWKGKRGDAEMKTDYSRGTTKKYPIGKQYKSTESIPHVPHKLKDLT